MFADELRQSLSQGDIIRDVRIVEPHLGTDERTFSVMVLSHGCEIDKPTSQVMLAAAVVPLADIGGDVRAIRNGTQLSMCYLPEIESAVDFRKTFRVTYQSVEATEFREIDGEEQRIFGTTEPRSHSLSKQGLAILLARLVAFYTREPNFVERVLQQQPTAIAQA